MRQTFQKSTSQQSVPNQLTTKPLRFYRIRFSFIKILNKNAIHEGKLT